MAQIDKPSEHFNTVTYTGNASGQTITGVGHQPDFIWIKQRGDAGYDHSLHNSVSGLLKKLASNKTDAEVTNTDTITSANADGFVLGADTAGPAANSVNQDTKNYVAWNWKANGAGSSNTDGDITSTVSANTTAGFSIVKYTGNGSNDQRVGHGLGARPTAWFIKRLGSADDWIVYHQGLATNWYDDTYLYLNSSNAVMGSVNAGTGNPTSSVFYIGDTGRTGASGDDYIAYVFAEKKGFSKFGSYSGNSSTNGTFVYTGFKPAFVIIKKHNDTANWMMYDNKREGYNVDNDHLKPNTNEAEGTSDDLDLLSNGFKLRTSGSGENSGNFIYMAFGQSLVGSNNVPCTAR